MLISLAVYGQFMQIPKKIRYDSLQRTFSKYQKGKVKQYSDPHAQSDVLVSFLHLDDGGGVDDAALLDLYRAELLKTYRKRLGSSVTSLFYAYFPYHTQSFQEYRLPSLRKKLLDLQSTLRNKSITFSHPFVRQIDVVGYREKHEIIATLQQKHYISQRYDVCRWSVSQQCVISDHDIVFKREQRFHYLVKCFMEAKRHTISVEIDDLSQYYGAIAVVVNPGDKRYKQFWGKNIILPIINKILPVIADDSADITRQTGVRFLVPCHNHHDMVLAKKHGLPLDSFSFDIFGHFTSNAKDYVGKHIDEFTPNIERFLNDISNLDDKYSQEHEIAYHAHTGEKLLLLASKQRYFSLPLHAPYPQNEIVFAYPDRIQSEEILRCISHDMHVGPKFFLHTSPNVAPTLQGYIQTVLAEYKGEGLFSILIFLSYMQGWIPQTFSFVDWINLVPEYVSRDDFFAMMDLCKGFCTTEETIAARNTLHQLFALLRGGTDSSTDLMDFALASPLLVYDGEDIFRLMIHGDPDGTIVFPGMEMTYFLIVSCVSDIDTPAKKGSQLTVHLLYNDDMVMYYRLLYHTLSALYEGYTFVVYDVVDHPYPSLSSDVIGDRERIAVLSGRDDESVDIFLHSIRNAVRPLCRGGVQTLAVGDYADLVLEPIDHRMIQSFVDASVSLDYTIQKVSLDESIERIMRVLQYCWAGVYVSSILSQRPFDQKRIAVLSYTVHYVFYFLSLLAPSTTFALCGFFHIQLDTLRLPPVLPLASFDVRWKILYSLLASLYEWRRKENISKKPVRLLFLCHTDFMTFCRENSQIFELLTPYVIESITNPGLLDACVYQTSIMDIRVGVVFDHQEEDPDMLEKLTKSIALCEQTIARVRGILTKIGAHEQAMRKKYEEELLKQKKLLEHYTNDMRKHAYHNKPS